MTLDDAINGSAHLGWATPVLFCTFMADALVGLEAGNQSSAVTCVE